MASTYRDSAGVERPTRWERVDPSGADLDEVLTPETWASMERSMPATRWRQASGMVVFDDPLQPDATGRGWCARLQRERDREVLAWWHSVQEARAALQRGMDRWTAPRVTT